MDQLRHHPMEQKLHEIYEKEYCLSPIPSLAMHSTNINSAYGVPPNVDLIKEKRGFKNKEWILPLNEKIKGF